MDRSVLANNDHLLAPWDAHLLGHWSVPRCGSVQAGWGAMGQDKKGGGRMVLLVEGLRWLVMGELVLLIAWILFDGVEEIDENYSSSSSLV